MAGNYPDHPAKRIAWHLLPGVAVLQVVNGSVDATYNSTERGTLAGDVKVNVGSNTNSGGPWSGYVIVFSTPVDVSHYLLGFNGAGSFAIYTSTDTTSGLDGTWTVAQSAAAVRVDPTSEDLRNHISALTTPGTGVVGIRIVCTTGSGARPSIFHFFGPQRTAAAQRLALWHPTANQPLGAADLDWGNAPRNGSADKTFRVKNLSATQTANAIAVTLLDSTDSSPSFTDAHYLSADGTTFTASLSSIGNLAPGAISGVLHLRRSLGASQPLVLWAAIVQAEAASWS